MSYRWTGAGLALLMLLPVVGSAQRSTSEDTVVGRYRLRTVPGGAFSVSMDDRPRLGLGLCPDSSSRGALVCSVTPGSGADDAGIREGDVITRFDGAALKRDDAVNDLVKRAENLKAGTKVRLQYLRDGNTRTADVEARNLNSFVFGNLERRNSMAPLPMMTEGMPALFSFGRTGLAASFAEMNEGLGEYFGTNEGLLVTRADSASPLKAGDVLLSIDGREPSSVAHAMRILASYEPGESVDLVVMRKRSRQTITWEVPKASGSWTRELPARRLAPTRSSNRT